MLAADLVISEFLAINDSVIFDEDGDASDWIEIHNPTSQEVSLSGWSLTDDATDLDIWSLPDQTIGAGEHLIVFASDKNRALAGSELHTNFKLDGDGEYLALVAESDVIATEFAPAFPKQREDVSFGTGQIVESDLIGMTAPPGTIYYTLDGSDPRLVGGALSPDELVYNGAILLDESTLVKARVRSGDTWSALSEATFLIGKPTLAISELQYHPADWPQGTSGDRDDFEFIEVFNYGMVPVDLDGVRFTDGVDFDFSGSSVSSLAAGQYGVVVRDLAAFRARYDTDGMTIIGEYLASGDHLSNSGERMELVDAFDQTIAAFSFKDGWHDLTDGDGFSLRGATRATSMRTQATRRRGGRAIGSNCTTRRARTSTPAAGS